AWEWDGERMQYFLHNFLTEQPDLNFHNPDVRSELLDVARYWLDRGVDGFRLDTVNFYFHDKELRDNPPLALEERNENTAPAVNPYNFQDHLYDKTQPENLGFIEALRALMNEYPAITSVGEVGESQRGPHVQAEYTKGDGRLHMCYDFDFLSNVYPTGTQVARVLDRFQDIVSEGWACWAYSNHDVVRHASRWGLGEEARRVYAALLMSMRGSVCLYQGEELGLTEAYVAFEDLQDPYGKRFWPKFKGRDGARTPMPWTTESAHGGFSEARPWLPLAMEHMERSVSRQENDETSTLAFYRRMIGFRKAYPALAKGDQQIFAAEDDRLALIRSHGGQRVFCSFNLGSDTQTVALPDGAWRQDKGAPFTTIANERGIALPPYQAFFAVAEDA
ncbi:MAG: alpha-amylase family glycosyl hydrolase, partial [Pseudomonadota bacterium]